MDSLDSFEIAGYSDLQICLARKIITYLFRNYLEKGDHLKEQELSKTFRVSRSPIRGALDYLTMQGITFRKANRGYFLCKDVSELNFEHIGLAQSSDEILCQRIAKDWFFQRLPEYFSEAQLRRQYDLGRLTLSRILLKLSEDGVISRDGGLNWRFETTLNTEKSYEDSCEPRLVLEPAALMLNVV